MGIGESEVREPRVLSGTDGESDDGFFTEESGEGGESGFIGTERGDNAAFLRDILPVGEKFGEDLETLGDAATDFQGKTGDGLEDTVDAEAEFPTNLIGLEMDVGGAAFPGFVENLIDELRSVGVRGLPNGFGGGQRGGSP